MEQKKKRELTNPECDELAEYQVRDISNELRDTISTFCVMQSCSTEIGQTITITGSLLSWVHAGLIYKYNGELTRMDERTRILMLDLVDETGAFVYPQNIRARWLEAIDLYNNSRHFWGEALKICNEIATDLISICVMHDMLDYTLVSQSVTQRMQTMTILDEDEQREKSQAPANGKKYGYGKTVEE